MEMLCCAMSGEKYKSKLTDQYKKYYDKYFPDFERHFKLSMQIEDISKFTKQYKYHVKAITGKTLAVNVSTIEAKKLSHLQITKDCNALLTEDVIDLGVITKRKVRVTIFALVMRMTGLVGILNLSIITYG